MEKINPRNYFFILDYLKSRGTSPTIAVRYSNEINKHKNLFETIKTKYDAKIFTKDLYISGRAKSLTDKDIVSDINSLKKFRKEFDSFNGIKSYGVINFIRPQCLQLTLFPNGDIHFCCCKNENTKICDILTDDFFSSLRDFNKNWRQNLYRGLLKPAKCNCMLSKLS